MHLSEPLSFQNDHASDPTDFPCGDGVVHDSAAFATKFHPVPANVPCMSVAVPAVRYGRHGTEMVHRAFSGALDGQPTALDGSRTQIMQIGIMETEEKQYGKPFNKKEIIK